MNWWWRRRMCQRLVDRPIGRGGSVDAAGARNSRNPASAIHSIRLPKKGTATFSASDVPEKVAVPFSWLSPFRVSGNPPVLQIKGAETTDLLQNGLQNCAESGGIGLAEGTDAERRGLAAPPSAIPAALAHCPVCGLAGATSSRRRAPAAYLTTPERPFLAEDPICR